MKRNGDAAGRLAVEFIFVSAEHPLARMPCMGYGKRRSRLGMPMGGRDGFVLARATIEIVDWGLAW
jgi:hypothetical protein